MIKKIVSLRGVGRFEGFKATGDVTFGKYTLIFAENGVGKTTLCDVIRSLQTGDPDYIMGRRTLGSAVEPEATVLLNDGSTARFSGGRWSKTPAGGCTIFDQVYVRDNVHAGEVVDIEHKRALFSLVVGERGVTLHIGRAGRLRGVHRRRVGGHRFLLVGAPWPPVGRARTTIKYLFLFQTDGRRDFGFLHARIQGLGHASTAGDCAVFVQHPDCG